MEITNQTGSGQLQGNALFYSRPEPLNAESHGKLGLRLPLDCSWHSTRS